MKKGEIKQLEKILERLIRLEREVFRVSPQSTWIPIKLSARGSKVFPRLIGEKAFKVISRKKLKDPSLILVKILGKKTISKFAKTFWEYK